MSRPTPLPPMSPTDVDRFHSRIAEGGPEDCWLWQGARDHDGYGLFKIKGVMRRANRIAFYLATGSDPGSLLTCHSCDTPQCCNPAHLFLGTVKDNAVDCMRKGRLNTPSGDNHRSRTHPESLARGDDHWSHRMPERVASGDRNGVRTNPDRIARGERLPQTRLTEAIVRIIRAEYAAGNTTMRDLADRFGVKRQAISKIVRRQRWTHVA